jgi:hypothetical protein
MKKWVVWLLVILILIFFSIYLFIPSKIVISRTIASEATVPGEFRYISQQDKWGKWWRSADGKPAVAELYSYNGIIFRLTNTEHNIAGIEIEQDGMKIPSVLHLVSLKKDSTIAAVWSCEIPAGKDPLTRISRYRQAIELSKNMKAILVNLQNFVSQPQNIYQISIFKTSFRDTSMLSGRFTSATYPTTAEFYSYFDVLKKNIKKQKGQISGYPMLNVRKLETDSFETQVAIPTSRSLENDGKLFYRKMVPGNFLCAIVKGGPYSIAESMKQLEYFLRDNNKTQMASPFQQLVTDRISEPDTLKWITRIYIPVVE